MTKSVLLCHGDDIFANKLLNTVYLEHFDIVISSNQELAEYLKHQCELQKIQCELYSAALRLEWKISGKWGGSLFDARTEADVWLIVIISTIIMLIKGGVFYMRILWAFLRKVLWLPYWGYWALRDGSYKGERGTICIKK